MINLMRTLGVLLVIGILAAGCDSVVDSDSALTETDVTIQSENSALASEAEVAAISSPEMGEVVYENTLHLEGSDMSAVDNNAQWAVRAGTCAAGTNTVAGNVDGYDDDYSWEDGYFAATLDISELEAGEYCFVLTTRQGAAEGNRQSQEFYIVDEYAKIGGTIGMGETRRGNSPTHSFDGVVGNAGSAGTVGSIMVNDREGEGYCTLTPTSLDIASSAAGGERALMYVNSTCWGDVLDFRVLDRNNDSGSLKRGGVYFPELELTGEPDAPLYNWVPMERGNNHVGTR